MKRLALLLPLVVLAACRDNGASVQIQAICFPDTTCTFSGKCGKVLIDNAAVNPAAGRLELFFQLENQLGDNTNKDTSRLNTNDAHIDQAVIEYGGALGGRAVVAAQGYVPASGTSVIGVDIIPDGLPLPTAPTFPAYLLATASMKLRGYYDDGARFETAEFPVSIQIMDFVIGGTCTSNIYCPGNGMYPAVCKGGT